MRREDLAALFPCEVALECGDPAVIEGELLSLELPLVARVVEKRRRELVAGRVLARRALTRLGLPEQPLLRGEDRAPIWPADVVGSITHTAGVCAVVVARRRDALGLGLDLEEVERLRDNLLPMISTPRERELLEREPPARRRILAALLFSAKESVYKCQYPLARRWLGFHDVELELDLEAGTFEARTRADLDPLWPPASHATGRFLVAGAWVASAATLERDAPRADDSPTE